MMANFDVLDAVLWTEQSFNSRLGLESRLKTLTREPSEYQ